MHQTCIHCLVVTVIIMGLRFANVVLRVHLLFFSRYINCLEIYKSLDYHDCFICECHNYTFLIILIYLSCFFFMQLHTNTAIVQLQPKAPLHVQHFHLIMFVVLIAIFALGENNMSLCY